MSMKPYEKMQVILKLFVGKKGNTAYSRLKDFLLYKKRFYILFYNCRAYAP